MSHQLPKPDDRGVTHGHSGQNHIPSLLVVNRWAAAGESGSHHDFRFRHDAWTMIFHQLGERITSIISRSWHFTTKSSMKTGVFTPTHETGILEFIPIKSWVARGAGAPGNPSCRRGLHPHR